MRVNRALVDQRLDLIRVQLRELEEMRKLPTEDFLELRNVAAAESFLRRSLEAVFDVGRHILARTGNIELAQEYKSIARGLGQEGIVPEDLAAELVRMAGYRNRLVHLYFDVTPGELHGIVHKELETFRVFIREIVRYCEGLT